MDEQLHKIRNASRPKSRQKSRIRFLVWFLSVVVVAFVVSGLAVGGLYLRLQNGPLEFAGLSERVVAALSSRFDPSWQVTLDNSALELENGSFALRVRGLEIRNARGRSLLRAPNTVISVDTASLMIGRLTPRLIDFHDLQAVGTINADGSITFVPGDESQQGAVAEAPAREPVDKADGQTFGQPTGQSHLSQGIEAFLDVLVGPGGPIGVLDKAQLTNLRLTLIDTQNRVRARFSRIDATFVRTADNGRTFDARLDGARGSWRLNGDAQPISGGYQLVFNVEDAPVQDILILSGLSTVPATTTLKVSGRTNVSLTKGVLDRLEGRFSTGEGRIDVEDKDATPLFVNSSTVSVSWDEASRNLSIEQLEFRAGDTHVLLTGNVDTAPGKPWNMRLAAKDAVLDGVTSSDKPIQVDSLEAVVSGSNGLSLDRLSLVGPNLNADIKATYGAGSDAKAIVVNAEVENTDVRSILCLWPEIVASSPRRYLVANLKKGMASKATVAVSLSGPDVQISMNGGSVPDESLRVDFSLDKVEFVPAPDLPPLNKVRVVGTVTGQAASVHGTDAVLVLPDGRSLNVPAASFEISNFWPKDAEAKILAQAAGNADALASYLRQPKIAEAFSWDIDPDDIKGKANLQIDIALAVNNIPKFADLPVNVRGELKELTVANAVGDEDLEKATISVGYDRGALALKGEGRVAGHPATIDMRQPPNGVGTGQFTFALDDAARARKGMDFGSQLTGIIPIKVAMSLTKNSQDKYEIEADLAKTAVNNLLPGWSKTSGKPGKVTFTATETAAGGMEVTDFVLDSGTVHFAGQANFDDKSALETANLSSFRLSPGDDMQIKVERGSEAYKVTIRGNLGDARPLIRSFSDNGRNAANGSKNGNGGNIDLDLALNIITGFNEEALTKATVKAAIRKGSLRQMQLLSKLGPMPLSMQTEMKKGSPFLTVQTDNAGALLRFFDIYRRMTGGNIILETALGDGAQKGFVMLRGFTIRNEPALKRIVPSQTQIERNRAGGDRRIDVNEATFTKARVDFIRSGSRIDFSDAAIWGAHIGFTLDGYLDYPRDRIDIRGTFVPAYGLNNAFAQVPLFGPLLGGGQYGGLFAVNFRLSGSANDPTVTVNPLSAVAPGIFRKLFGAGSAAPVMPDGVK